MNEHVIPSETRQEPQPVPDFLQRARELRPVFTASALDLDETGKTAEANIALLRQAGFQNLLVPKQYGGMAADDGFADWEMITELQMEIAAGESSTAHVWCAQVFARSLFGLSELPESTKQQLASEFLGGAGWCGATAETGPRRYTMNTRCVLVPGGVRVTGTKKYGTGSDVARYAFNTARLGDSTDIAKDGIHFMMVRLDAPGVTVHHDWDFMGQRATGTNTIQYDNVFVPDGFHWHSNRNSEGNWAENRTAGLAAQLMFTATILGMGFGALEALTEALTNRTAPTEDYPSPLKDPSIQYDVGRYSAALAAAKALVLQTSRAIAKFARDGLNRGEVSVMMMQAKIASVDATMLVSSDMFRNLGARNGERQYDMDRFWRNARAMTLHDQINVKYRHIGRWVLEGISPPVTTIS